MKAMNLLHKLRHSPIIIGVLSLLWYAFRTGSKPSRAVYPCQRAALANSTILLQFSIIPVFIGFGRKLGRGVIVAILLVSAFAGGLCFIKGTQGALSSVHLTLNPMTATASSASNIYVVNDDLGSDTGMSNLVSTMSSNGLDFYGLFSKDDVVLIKINWQWPYRGGTNTDLIKGLIAKILSYPGGFSGEIIVADNGQGKGSTDWGSSNNAEDTSQSTQDVVNSFTSSAKVSTYLWDGIRAVGVNEYDVGDMNDGYIISSTSDPITGIQVSYPKFRTGYGTYVSFKKGIWTGSTYQDKLRIINVATLKSHIVYGATTSVKHYMGVVTESAYNQGGLTASHDTIAIGGMGTLMVQTRYPILNIIDAIYINALPLAGPQTPYDSATKVNVVAASKDPIALDYWSMKYVLKQTCTLSGYDTRSLDPDYTGAPLGQYQVEVPGVWLRKSMNAMLTLNPSLQVTMDEARMNVYLYSQSAPMSTTLTMNFDPEPTQTPYRYRIYGALSFTGGTGISGARLRFYIGNSSDATILTTIVTQADGSYQFYWYASVTGQYTLRAVYNSDRPNALGTSTERTVSW